MANGVQIGALHVSLSAESTAFDRGMNEAGKKSKDVTQEIAHDAQDMSAKIESYAAEIAASLTSAFAIAYASERIKEQIDYADALADVAARSNQTAESLSKMEYALHFQDATLQDYTDGLQKLSQNMVSASEGSKEQAIIFEALGIKLRDQDAQLKNSGDVILEFADKLANMSNGATKTQLAMDVLGKSAGPALLPFLNQGKAGIEAFTKKAEEMGLVVGTDFSDASGQLNDNLDNLAFAATGAWRVIASQLTPALVDLSSALLSANENGAKQASILGNIAAAGVRAVGSVFTGAAEIGSLTVDATGKLMALSDVGVSAFTATGQKALDARNQFGEIWKSTSVVDNYVDALGRQKTVLFGLSEAQKEYAENSAWANWVMTDLDGQTQKLATIAYEERKKQLIEEQANKAKAVAEAQKLQEKQISDVVKVRESLMTDIEAEQSHYNQKLLLLQTASDQAFAFEGQRNELMLKVKKDHLDKIDALEIAASNKRVSELLNDPYFVDISSKAEQSVTDTAANDAFYAMVDSELVAMDAANVYKLNAQQEFNNSWLLLDQDRINKVVTNGDVELEAKKAQMAANVSFFQNGLNSMAQGQSKAAKAAQAIQKAQALYEIGVNTYRAATGAYAALAPIPLIGPALGVAAAGLAIAFGASMAQGVLSGGSPSSVVGGAPSALPSSSTDVIPRSEQRAQEQANMGITYIRVPLDRMMSGSQLIDFIDEVRADGKEFRDLRFIAA